MRRACLNGVAFFVDARIVGSKPPRQIRMGFARACFPRGSFVLITEAAKANEVLARTITKNCTGYSRDGKTYLPKVGWSFKPKDGSDSVV